jgi:hypothetical protein
MLSEDLPRSLIQNILVGGNHLASALLAFGCSPADQKNYDSVLAASGQPAADMWIAWRAIMDLSEWYERPTTKAD